VRPTSTAYAVAAAFVTAWSLKPYSDELPVLTKRTAPCAAAASIRFTVPSRFVRVQRTASACEE